MATPATKKKPFLRYYTHVIPAGRKIPFDYGGSYFICKESDAEFKVAFDDGGENPCEVGIGFRHTDEDGNPTKFKKVTFINTSAADVTVGVYIGSNQVIDARLNTLITRTILVGTMNADTQTIGMSAAVATGTTAYYSGLLGSRKRKSFSVFNKSTVDDLIIVAANGLEMWRVAPRQGYVVETGDPVGVQGTTAAVPYTGCEVFYNQ